MKKIKSILKQFTMFAYKEYPSEVNDYKITPYDQRLAKLGMVSLHCRRINCSLIFLRDIIYMKSPSEANEIRVDYTYFKEYKKNSMQSQIKKHFISSIRSIDNETFAV